MRADWPNQNVRRHVTRHARYIIASDFEAQLLACYKDLNNSLSQGEVLKHDQTTTVARHNGLIVKRYNPRSQLHKVKRAFRRSRASRCWVMSYAFNRADLNVAQPIMMYERRVGPIRTDAYFVSKDLYGEELLSALPNMCDEQQQKVLSALRHAFVQMRKHKLTHGDMKASNLLWVDGELFFVDLDAAKQHKTKSSWKISHSKDIKRFLKNWQNYPKLTALFSALEH